MASAGDIGELRHKERHGQGGIAGFSPAHGDNSRQPALEKDSEWQPIQLVKSSRPPAWRTSTYAIRDLVVIADQIAREGKEILYLNIGDPCLYGFQTPPHMIEAAHKAMTDGINGYGNSLGLNSAVQAIRNEAEGKGFENIQSVFVTMGSGEAVDACLTALVNPGDNVLTPCPDYPLYSATLAKNSCVLTSYRLKEEEGWEPDLDDMAAKINSRTRGIVIINPNNPTGAVYSRRTLEAIAELARRNNLIIFSDEIYDRLILDPTETHVPIATLAPDVPVVTFNGLSKAYCCPGWRLGWGIATGPEDSLKPFLEGVYKLLRSRLSAPHPLQYAIQPALEGPQDHLRAMNQKLRCRRDITQSWCDAHTASQLRRSQGGLLRVSEARHPGRRHNLRA